MAYNKDETVKRTNLASFKNWNKVDDKDEAGKVIGDFVVQKINEFLDGSKSSVKKGKFKTFKKDGDPSVLFEDGDLRSAIRSEFNGNNLFVGVFSDSSEAAKSYGHNSGFKGHKFLDNPKFKREFIPRPNQTYKKNILNGIQRIINEFAEKKESNDGNS